MPGVGRLTKTIGATEATSPADAATRTPRAASGAVASALVSNTTSWYPASSSRDAIGPPILPTPTNPRTRVSVNRILPVVAEAGRQSTGRPAGPPSFGTPRAAPPMLNGGFDEYA